MFTLYNILLHFANVILKIFGLFNHKIKLGVVGRRKTFNRLNKVLSKGDKSIWFHCASLGEYEQGLPVFEEIIRLYPSNKIVLSFFSPSGFESKKNTSIADLVVYLPIDTKRNARDFLNILNPELVIFVKYEFWPNYLNEIIKQNKKAILISALLRPNQIFFKPYGKWMPKYLKAFDHFFVQNELSKKLFNSIGFQNVTISGDTRYDRVSNQLKMNNSLPSIEEFKDNKLCFVAGSTWPEGEDLICDYINSNPSLDIKFIIAPHDVKPNRIKQLQKKLKTGGIIFSEKDNEKLKEGQVLIINTIGLLSKIYSYADITYVGGALGSTGLHNILEPAVFGSPIIIGKNHTKFPEAKLMIEQGGVFCINSKLEFKSVLSGLIKNVESRKQAGLLNSKYIEKNKGAVIQILDYLRR
ncbi:MAG: 3-deoxy-D-manno-octulosonic acid transferase [Flavobacteriaceae bacterium]|nr:3-deoxy-D-manno-octulosonic acid transferase [Flavobacteriaceae bacterium]